MSPSLPADLVKDGVTRTATTPSEYWTLVYGGFAVVDGPATASVSYDELTPGQKAARTRALNRAREEGDDSIDTSSEAVDSDLDNQAGDANENTDSSSDES